MTLRNWMQFKSVVCLVVGLLFVFVPQLLLVLFGVSGGEPAGMMMMARLYGATFVLLGLVLWMARGLSEADARHVAALPVVVGDGASFVIALSGQLGNTMNALGWFVVGIYLVLTLGFAYFAFARRAPAAKPA